MRGINSPKKNDRVHLPPGWANSRLGELGQYFNGRGFKKSEWGTTGRPIIRIQDLTGTSANPNYFDGDVEERHVIRHGDFLISWAATLGAYIYKGPEGLLNQHIFKVQTFIDKSFHFHAVTYAIDDMYRRTRGTGMVHIVKADFDGTKIPLPPLPEQARIADRIDELVSDLSAGTAALGRVKRNLSRYRSAVLHAAVTGCLTESWRKEHKKVDESGSKLLERILADRRRQWEQRTLDKYEKNGKNPPKNWRNRYPEPVEPRALPDGSPFSSLPKNWTLAIHDQVGDVQLGRQRSPQHHNGEHMRPYLRVANVYEDRIDTTNVLEMNFTPGEFEVYALKHGDILLNEGQSLELVGRPAMYKDELPGGCFQNTLVRQRVFSGVLPEYALIVCRAQYRAGRFREIASITTSIAHLGAQRFAGLEFPLPPEREQAVIVEHVNEKLSQIDALETEIERGLKRSERLRQAILKAAFEGKLVPQDANDEPASFLLERIRNEATETKLKRPQKQRKKKKSSRKNKST